MNLRDTAPQFLPATIASIPEPWFILNVTRVEKCIDDARSRHKVGTYRAVHGMRIDPTKIEGAHIFRNCGWLVAIVVSQELKKALELAHVTGTRFIEV